MLETKLSNLETEFKLDPKSVAVVEITRYPNWYSGCLNSIGDTDKIRGDLALQSIQGGVARGHHMIIADGGSATAFEEELFKFSEIILIRHQEYARAPRRRLGLLAASAIEEVKAIIHTEPEKVSIVSKFSSQLVRPLLDSTAELVVAKRNPNTFLQTFPKYMWVSETSANKRYNGLLHKEELLTPDQALDMFFGPTAFVNNPKVLELFLKKYKFLLNSSLGVRKYPYPEDYSDGRYFPVVEALHKRFKVESVEVDFQYPDLQRQNEESVALPSSNQFIEKRKREKWVYLDELVHLIRYLRKDPKSGLVEIE